MEEREGYFCLYCEVEKERESRGELSLTTETNGLIERSGRVSPE